MGVPLTATGVIPGTSRRVLRELVPQTAALRDAFAAHFRKPLVITDGWRSYAEQVDLFRRYYTTTRLPGRPSRYFDGAWWYQRVGFPSAAVPGQGMHPAGLALDLGSGVNTSLTSPEHLWMRENGPTFGWIHPTWAHDGRSSNGTDEPWHHEAAATPVPVSRFVDYLRDLNLILRPVDPLPDALTREEDDVNRLIRNANTRDYGVAGGHLRFTPLGSMTQLEALIVAGQLPGVDVVRDQAGNVVDVTGDVELVDGLVWDTLTELDGGVR